MFTCEIDNGKYHVIQQTDGRLIALRHGKEWRDLTGDKLIYCLASELENTRQELREMTEKYLDSGR